jgi:hypothetical protein
MVQIKIILIIQITSLETILPITTIIDKIKIHLIILITLLKELQTTSFQINQI